jgi:hypothetical protein
MTEESEFYALDVQERFFFPTMLRTLINEVSICGGNAAGV